MTTRLPLFFSFQQVILGDGYIAGVRMNGRALLEDDGSETWIGGVTPVGLAGGGVDRSTAYMNFRKSWVEVIFDIAADCAGFAEFREQCQEFFESSSTEILQSWQDALEEVRSSGKTDPELQTVRAEEQDISFEVIELTNHKYGPSDNQVGFDLRVAA